MFEIQTTYTFEEYKRYVYDTDTARRKFAPDAYRKSGLGGTLIIVYLIGSTVFAIWGAFRLNDIYFAVFAGFLIGSLIIGGVAVALGSKNEKRKSDKNTDEWLRKVWSSDKLNSGCTMVYAFGDDGFTARTPNSEARVGYEDICYLAETPTNFYIMISLTKGYIISKDSTDKDARMFIRSHCGINGSVNVGA